MSVLPPLKDNGEEYPLLNPNLTPQEIVYEALPFTVSLTVPKLDSPELDALYGHRKHSEDINDELSRIQQHLQFLRKAEPWLFADNAEWQHRSLQELTTVEFWFPHINHDKTILCMAAWLHFVCSFDDLIESMFKETDVASVQTLLTTAVSILSTPVTGSHLVQKLWLDGRVGKYYSYEDKSKHLCASLLLLLTCLRGNVRMLGLQRLLYNWVDGISREVYYRFELSKNMSGVSSMEHYLSIRTQTIAVQPLFYMIGTYLSVQTWTNRIYLTFHRLEADEAYHNPSVQHIVELVSSACGLQNDLAGLEKDLKTREQMNYVVVASGIDASF